MKKINMELQQATHTYPPVLVFIYMNYSQYDWMKITWCPYKSCCCKELWDGMIFFSLMKDGPVYHMLEEIIKEALERLSLIFRGFGQLLSWLLLEYFQVVSLRQEGSGSVRSI